MARTQQPKVGRLAIQFGVVFALAMGFAGVLMFFIAEARLTAEVDKSLLRDRDRLLGSPGKGPEPLALPKLTRRIADWEAKRTISDKGHVVFDAAGHPLFGNIVLSMPPEGYSAVTFRDGDGIPREGRAYRQQLGGGTSLVIVAHSEIVEDLNAILPPLAVVLSLTIAAAGIAATWLFARQIAIRLVETQHAADAIANGNLKRRVPMNRLDGMFAVQAASFNRMLDRMEEMLKVQRQFASNLAHDLRTPLTRLRGLLASPDEDHDRMVQRAERECASIIAIFDALLRLSEIEAGRHPTALGPLLLKNVIEDVTESMEPVLADSGSALIVGPLEDMTILADGPLIHQLLVNLLENIALHTPPGTTAQVSLREDRAGEMAMLTIADDGPGLPTNERARVLQPFERGSTSDTVSGSGLGLAIAQAIVRFHRGELQLADNQPGLAVEIWLPMVGLEPPSSVREQPELVG